jgi:hypothetical protein
MTEISDERALVRPLTAIGGAEVVELLDLVI